MTNLIVEPRFADMKSTEWIELLFDAAKDGLYDVVDECLDNIPNNGDYLTESDFAKAKSIAKAAGNLDIVELINQRLGPITEKHAINKYALIVESNSKPAGTRIIKEGLESHVKDYLEKKGIQGYVRDPNIDPIEDPLIIALDSYPEEYTIDDIAKLLAKNVFTADATFKVIDSTSEHESEIYTGESPLFDNNPEEIEENSAQNTTGPDHPVAGGPNAIRHADVAESKQTPIIESAPEKDFADLISTLSKPDQERVAQAITVIQKTNPNVEPGLGMDKGTALKILQDFKIVLKSDNNQTKNIVEK